MKQPHQYRPLEQQPQHDACGIGAVVNISGQRTHETLDGALKIVEKLAHRTGKDADGTTGDGVGVMTQLPHALFQKAAQQALSEYGGLPSTAEELIRLPGIGPYTAGAVASIAFGRPVPAVDGNVLRVVARLMAYDGDISKDSVKKGVAEALVPSVVLDPAAFNQAVMELGATVCLPNGAPKCGGCPVRRLCLAHEMGAELSFPVKKAKKVRKIQQKTIFLLEFENRTAVCRRPESGLLAGLWGFPESDDYLEQDEAELYLEHLGFETETVLPLKKSKHIFSHMEWHMAGYRAVLRKLPDFGARRILLPEGTVFLTKEEIEARCALPSAYKAYTKELR